MESEVKNGHIKLAKASGFEGQPPFGEGYGTFMLPYGQDSAFRALGLSPEKLIVPKDYHAVLQMVYDFYQRGGLATTVINRLTELCITDIRNGQRQKTTDEQNAYFEAVLHRQPSRLMRFLRTAALEYFLSGMVIPRVDYEVRTGAELSPNLTATKEYTVPVFDLYPPNLVHVYWVGWGEKEYYIKVPQTDINLIKRGGSKIKEQQLRYNMWIKNFPEFVDTVKAGGDKVLLRDVDPILRKEVSFSPYPTPYLGNALEGLIYKQQLKRMDFAVASRVINAILLVQEGSDEYPITEETRGNLDELKAQILARSNNPRLMERLFILFSNHTTKLTWITPDVDALLDQEKYRQVNNEISESLGFTRVLITGEQNGTGNASEVSTWALHPMMDELRQAFTEWITWLYEDLSTKNKFRNTPVPMFKPIKLQDFVKSAAVFASLFTEGNLSRTTRNELVGTDFETEVELMKDEKELMADLPPFPPMPYSPLPPMTGPSGRPIGSQNVPLNKRNTGTKPGGQKPVSRLKAAERELSDEEVIQLLNKVAEDLGLEVTIETIKNTPEISDET